MKSRKLTFDFIRPPDRHLSVHSDLLEATDDVIVMAHEPSPSKPLNCSGEVVFAAGYLAVWFLFKNQPFDVGRIYRPDGTWTGCYVDVLEPVRWKGSDPTTLEPLIDLFLDLWIAPDGSFLVLDEDEFEEAIALGRLTRNQVDHGAERPPAAHRGDRTRRFPACKGKRVPAEYSPRTAISTQRQGFQNPRWNSRTVPLLSSNGEVSRDRKLRPREVGV